MHRTPCAPQLRAPAGGCCGARAGADALRNGACPVCHSSCWRPLPLREAAPPSKPKSARARQPRTPRRHGLPTHCEPPEASGGVSYMQSRRSEAPGACQGPRDAGSGRSDQSGPPSAGPCSDRHGGGRFRVGGGNERWVRAGAAPAGAAGAARTPRTCVQLMQPPCKRKTPRPQRRLPTPLRRLGAQPAGDLVHLPRRQDPRGCAQLAAAARSSARATVRSRLPSLRHQLPRRPAPVFLALIPCSQHHPAQATARCSATACARPTPASTPRSARRRARHASTTPRAARPPPARRCRPLVPATSRRPQLRAAFKCSSDACG